MAMAEEPSSEALCSKKEVEIEAEKHHPLLPLSETSLPQSGSSISFPVTCTTTPSDLAASSSSPPEKLVEVKDSGVEIVAASDSAVNNSTESFNGGSNDGGAEQRSPSHVTPGVSAAVSGNSSESSPIASVTVDGMRLPLVAVPCFIAPAALLESSGFASHFAITHQAVLATVTAQAQRNLQSRNIPQPAVSLMPIASTPEKPSEENILSPETDQEQISHSKTESPRTGSTKTPIDGFNWRKYGQKQVKGTENARSYYRCTHASCTAKKKVEHRYDGHVLEVVYRGVHNHSPPPKARFPKEKRPLAIVLSEDNQISTPVSFKSPGAEPSPLNSVPPNFQGSGCDKRLHCSSDCEADGDAKGRGTHGEEPDLKRRSVEGPKFTSPSPLAIVIKTAKEPKVIRHLTSDPGSLSDGYRWRKYGQKFVKGNPNPRSYYRCTQVGCPARKHVEKDSTDDGAVIINYEGKHNHDVPPPKTPSSAATVANCPPPAADLLVAAAAAIEAGNHVAPISTKPSSSESAADSSLESAQTLLSIGGARPLFDDHRPAVSVQNS